MARYEGHRADMHSFLVRMYELSGGDRARLLDMWEVGDSLNFTRDEINMIVQHLAVESLIDLRSHNGRVGITSHGILEVEEALGREQPEESGTGAPTPEPEDRELPSPPAPKASPAAPPSATPKPASEPAPNEKQAAGKKPVGSPPDSNLKAAFEGEVVADKGLSGFVRNLRPKLATLGLGPDDYGEMLADLGTIELQIDSPRPNRMILMECLSSIGRILREADNAVARKLIRELADLL